MKIGWYKYIVLWKLSLSLITCSLSTISIAQISQPHRYEKIQEGSDDYFTIIPMNSEGLTLLRHKDKFVNSKRVWEIIFLDTALQVKKALEFEVDIRNNLVGHEYVQNHLYLLYRQGEDNKNTLQLIDFAEQGEQNVRYDIKAGLDFKLTHFTKAGNHMILGGYVSKDPVVLIYDLLTNLIKVVPGFFQKDNELVDLRVNQNQTFNTLEIDRSNKTERKIIFRTFDETGELLLEDDVPFDNSKSPQSSITTTLEREELMIMGTWSDRQSKQATGFFSLAVDPFNNQQIKYIDFAQLLHYLDYMKPSRAKRIKENSEKNNSLGKNPNFVNYVMPFRIEENKKGFLLFSEVYNPVYTNQFNNNAFGNPMYGSYYPYYYNPYMPSYYYPYRMYRPIYSNSNAKSTSDIQTTESVVIAIDEHGKLLWDASMKIEDIKRPILEQVSDFYYANNHVVLMYKQNETELWVKSIDLENDIANEGSEKIKLLYPLDDFRSEKDEQGLKYWYGNSFYVYGYQTIRNTNLKDRMRDVFYLNKIVVK